MSANALVRFCGSSHNALIAADKPHRVGKNGKKYMPTGFEKIQDKWDGLCSYTGTANHNKNPDIRNSALCNIPSNTHTWKKPSDVNPGCE